MGPISEAVVADVLKEMQFNTIRDRGSNTQGRVPGTEVSHVKHVGRFSSREGKKNKSSWSRIAQFPIIHSDLKELEGQVGIGRPAQEFMGYGRANLSYKTVFNVMSIRNKAWERRNIYYRLMAAYRSFLKQNDVCGGRLCKS